MERRLPDAGTNDGQIDYPESPQWAFPPFQDVTAKRERGHRIDGRFGSVKEGKGCISGCASQGCADKSHETH